MVPGTERSVPGHGGAQILNLSNPNKSEKECVAELLDHTRLLLADRKSVELASVFNNIPVADLEYTLGELLNTDLWFQSWWDVLKLLCRVEGELPEVIGKRGIITIESDGARAVFHVVVPRVESREGQQWIELVPWRPWFLSKKGKFDNPLIVEGK